MTLALTWHLPLSPTGFPSFFPPSLWSSLTHVLTGPSLKTLHLPSFCMVLPYISSLHAGLCLNAISPERPPQLPYLKRPLKNMKVLVAQLCLTLCNPMDYSPPGSSVHGILQARTLEWVAIPFLRGSSWLRSWTWISHIAGRFFIIWATREAPKRPLGILCVLNVLFLHNTHYALPLLHVLFVYLPVSPTGIEASWGPCIFFFNAEFSVSRIVPCI